MDARVLREVARNYLEEVSSKMLYERLAALDPKPKRRDTLSVLASFEDRHASLWKSVLDHHQYPAPTERMILKHRIFAGLARVFGVTTVLSAVHKDEVDGIKKYHAQLTAWKDPELTRIFETLLPDEFSHEIDTSNEARSAAREGGSLRSAVLGANDGIGTILALSAGVVGATSSNPEVLIAGTAGLVAGAISMAASNYVSVKAEAEMFTGLRTLERDAIEVDRSTKVLQLTEIYLQKGFSRAEAQSIVARIATDDEEFARVLLAERHGVGESSFSNPVRLGLITGVAFGLAGAVPLLPFFFLAPLPSMVVSVAASTVVLFATGVFRSLSTLTSLGRGGLEMVVIGLGSAALTYLIGLGIGGFLH